MNAKAIGRRIQERRERLKLTQADVAKRSGISGMHISHFECGRRLPNIENAVKLARSLGWTLDFMITGRAYEMTDEEPQNANPEAPSMEDDE